VLLTLVARSPVHLLLVELDDGIAFGLCDLALGCPD